MQLKTQPPVIPDPHDHRQHAVDGEAPESSG